MTEPPGDASTLIDYWGGIAYEAYFRHCQGKSIRGESLPAWKGQDPAIRAHWFAAAKAVKLAAESDEARGESFADIRARAAVLEKLGPARRLEGPGCEAANAAIASAADVPYLLDLVHTLLGIRG
jgi:hypothetical protein